MRPPSMNSCVMMWPYLTPESSVCTWKTLPLWRTLLLYPRRGDVGLGDMESASATAQAKQCTTSASRTNSLGDYGDLPCCRIGPEAPAEETGTKPRRSRSDIPRDWRPERRPRAASCREAPLSALESLPRFHRCGAPVRRRPLLYGELPPRGPRSR